MLRKTMIGLVIVGMVIAFVSYGYCGDTRSDIAEVTNEMITYLRNLEPTHNDEPINLVVRRVWREMKKLKYMDDPRDAEGNLTDVLYTPSEMRARGGGDCEDMVLYFLAGLREANVDIGGMGFIHIFPDRQDVPGHIMALVFSPIGGRWLAFELTNIGEVHDDMIDLRKLKEKEYGTLCWVTLYGLNARSLGYVSRGNEGSQMYLYQYLKVLETF